jgi:hypothetical protein
MAIIPLLPVNLRENFKAASVDSAPLLLKKILDNFFWRDFGHFF